MILIKADKSRNIYKISPLEYKILHNKIMEMYKIDNEDTINQINEDTTKFANKLNIKDKLEKKDEKNAYILFKQNFNNY